MVIVNEISSVFSCSIKEYVETLLNEPFKVSDNQIKLTVTHPTSGCLTVSNNGTKCDRFYITIPYAGDSITWQIIFDCTQPRKPPDFVFGKNDEGFYPDIEELHTLVMWDPQDSKSLIYVLHELLQSYHKYQLSLLENTQLHIEYEELLRHSQGEIENVELLVCKNENGTIGPVKFLIKLILDLSKIPIILSKDCPRQNSAVILVTYAAVDGYRITPQLYLSPAVEIALGGSSQLRIPSFSAGETLFEYVSKVSQLLKNKVKNVIGGYEKRKEYVAAFIAHYGRSVLEYDKESFHMMSFLFEWNDFFFIFRIEIPLYFPKEQPTFIFQSIYHETKGKPYTEVFQEYPYSPRWSGNEMAERARLFILDKISSFQKSSVLA